MKEKKPDVSVSEAALTFLASLSPEDRQERQQEVNRFVLWYGRERTIRSLTVIEIARYGEQQALSYGEARRRLAPVRDFLTYAKKKGLVETSLASHLGAGKGSSRSGRGVRRRPKKEVLLTAEAQARMKDELAALKEERPGIAEEIRRAAADKDFRENAPLEAAREHHEQLEARIKELEATLNSAVVHEAEPVQTQKAGLSTTVVLQDLSSGERLSYTLVSPNEVAPAQGKISIYSPVGKALVGHRPGEVVEVSAPSGRSSYRIEGVERQV